MPWQEVSAVSIRFEFCTLAVQGSVPLRELCRRFEVSPKTGYKWLSRFQADGLTGLHDRSRRPAHSPHRTPPTLERAVLAVRSDHPAWGGRKIGARLRTLRHRDVPAASTITAILRRHGRLDPDESAKHRAVQRFEAAAPNDLWQMDFKGHFPLRRGRCHPLTVLDDHSRYAIGLEACTNERSATVIERLTSLFQHYGLPRRMLMDNGPPFGACGLSDYTPLTVWLIRLGIRVTHGRPYHPQTQGKDERFHRTLKQEVIERHRPQRMADCQVCFDRWRRVYNHERPHDALDLAVPATRYRPSPRSFPNRLEPIDYPPGDLVRRVQAKAEISVYGRTYRVGRAFRGLPVALRATTTDGVMEVWFYHERIGRINLRRPR